MMRSLGKAAAIAATALSIAGCSVETGHTGAIVGAAGEARDGAWEREFEQGKESLGSGYLGLALQQFRSALGMNPQSVRVLNAVAVAYDRLGRYDLAELYYDRALALEPESAATLNNVGYSLLTQERYEEALIYFERALVQKQPPAEARMVAANRNLALDRLQLARQRKGGTDVARAADIAAPAKDGCRSPASAVGRAGERVFALVTTRALTTLAEPPCEEGGHVRVAMLQTRPPEPQGPAAPATERIPAPASAVADAPVAAPPARAVSAPAQPSVPALAPALKVEVSNGAGRNKLAARMRAYLTSRGLPVSYLTNAASFRNRTTTIFHKPGQRQAAERFAKQLPIAVELREVTDGYADIRIRLGRDILEFDSRSLYALKHGDRNV